MRKIIFLIVFTITTLLVNAQSGCNVIILNNGPERLLTEYLDKTFPQLLNEDMEPGVYKTRDETDIEIAKLKLKTMGVEIDQLSDDQKVYMNSWDVGT